MLAPVSNTIVSTNDNRCIFFDGNNIYSYSISYFVTKVFFGAKVEPSEKPRRVFFDDKKNVTIHIFDKYFSLFSKNVKG